MRGGGGGNLGENPFLFISNHFKNFYFIFFVLVPLNHSKGKSIDLIQEVTIK